MTPTIARTRVLVDTDIGSDIDDAYALGYLLRQPRAEVIGITTVTAPSHARAQLASAVCRAAGHPDIPIVAGCESPLDPKTLPVQTEAPQAEVLGQWPHAPGQILDDTAPAFLSRMIRQHPHEIELLAIGPQTNLGALLREDPEALQLLRRLVVMGGMIEPQGTWNPRIREWNFRLDPEAADAVYRSGAPAHRSIVADVTVKTFLRKRAFAEWSGAASTPLRHLLHAMTATWLRDHAQIGFHDPLAAATMFDDQVCTLARGLLTVVLTPRQRAGRTLWQTALDGPHEIATGVDTTHFFAHLQAIL